MKLLLNNEYEDVGFWSFMKCSFLVSLALTGLTYALLFLILILAVI